MSGTKLGGQRAARTNKERHGENFYAKIGAKGGRNGCTGGFASDVVGKDGLTGRERAKKAGQIGGLISRRGPAFRDKNGKIVRRNGKKCYYNKDKECPTEVSTPEHGKQENVHLWQKLFHGGNDA